MVLASLTGMTFSVQGLAGKCACGSEKDIRACTVFASIPLAKARHMAEAKIKKSGQKHCLQ